VGGKSARMGAGTSRYESESLNQKHVQLIQRPRAAAPSPPHPPPYLGYQPCYQPTIDSYLRP
jgi:hypothetical protein